MLNLDSECFTVQNNKIVEGTLRDFERFIETVNTPYGIQRKYFIKRANFQNNEIWALCYWQLGVLEKILFTFDDEQSAQSKLEEFAAFDILNNNEIFIHLNRKSAENELHNLLEDQTV